MLAGLLTKEDGVLHQCPLLLSVLKRDTRKGPAGVICQHTLKRYPA